MGLTKQLRRNWAAWGSPTDRDKCVNEKLMAMDCKEGADRIDELEDTLATRDSELTACCAQLQDSTSYVGQLEAKARAFINAFYKAEWHSRDQGAEVMHALLVTHVNALGLVLESSQESNNGSVRPSMAPGQGTSTPDHNQRPAGLSPAAPTPIPEGWKLVPVVPTEGMTEAGAAVWKAARIEYDLTGSRSVYRAMLAAAPAPPDDNLATMRRVMEGPRVVEGEGRKSDDVEWLHFCGLENMTIGRRYGRGPCPCGHPEPTRPAEGNVK